MPGLLPAAGERLWRFTSQQKGLVIMMNRRSICGLTALFVVCLAATAVNASTITTLIGPGVNNGSFESPVIGGTGAYNSLITVPTGWNDSTIMQNSPNGTYSVASEGDQGIAVVNYSGAIKCSISLGSSFQPDTVYTMTMDASSNFASSVSGTWWLADPAGSSVEEVIFTVNNGSHQTWEAVDPIVVNTTLRPDFVGKLIVMGVWNGSGDQLWVDNVTLTAAAVPEPATFALLATGVMGILVCARRRRK